MLNGASASQGASLVQTAAPSAPAATVPSQGRGESVNMSSFFASSSAFSYRTLASFNNRNPQTQIHTHVQEDTKLENYAGVISEEQRSFLKLIARDSAAGDQQFCQKVFPISPLHFSLSIFLIF